MKKVLCFAIVILIVLSVCSFSVFATDDVKLSHNFYDYCVEVLPEDMQPIEEDTVKVYRTEVVDGVTFFSANCCLIAEYADVICKFGNVNIYSYQKYQPYELGLYAASGDEIYTLKEAYDNGLIDDVSVLEGMFAGKYPFYEDYVPGPENKFESYVVQKVFKPSEWADPSREIIYHERYEYYSEEMPSNDEATPDYALIYLRNNMSLAMPVVDVYGDYVLHSMSAAVPFTYGYCLYVPNTGEVYSLENAYDMGIEGIEKVFTEAGVGRLIGDMDADRKLTVKDATFIQKVIAGIEGFTDLFFDRAAEEGEPCAISDFNRDGNRDIRDATAIQKYLVGLPY